ncbi:ABC transporter ATP-binding protein [Sporanaerobium hydrogeniformans]|uniref:ABC transporter ATP-binding protein n=1 Tax=Sporanaerobium hydrogeniformans TaxID=3072179 RepID=A0AC61DCF1_9FIRM|nr:ABC transporter ATP-binding protein [Sporanaerobium hydrogeniformans]
MLEAKNITKIFQNGFGKKSICSLKNVDITLNEGEILGLMGPSGCGKSTLARILLRLLPTDSGEVLWKGEAITKKCGHQLLAFQRGVQFIPQRPESSFDPRLRLGKSVVEPLSFFKESWSEKNRKRLQVLLTQLSISEELLGRYPHQVSGGEIQRLALCRALLLQPEVLILDESTSMLDVSVQAQMIQILADLQEKHHLSYLFITHDRELANYFCNRIIVMEKGEILKKGILQN